MLSNSTIDRINNIIKVSKEVGDVRHIELEKQISQGVTPCLKYHKSCVSTYTSSYHRGCKLHKRRLPNTSKRSASEPPLIRRKSEFTEFKFQEDCLYCGEICLPKDPKNPKRWRRVVKCMTAERKGNISFKESVLEKCDERGLNDKWGNEVRIRVVGAMSDFHAADAQYHQDCYSRFNNLCNIKTTNSIATEDSSLKAVFDAMLAKPSHIWTSIELHKIYMDKMKEHCGEDFSTENIMACRHLMSKVTDHFGSSLIEMHIKGCANLYCFKDHLPENLVCETVSDTEATMDLLVNQIINESRQSPKHMAYDLSKFTKATVIESTSQTLVTLISKLVSNGNITKCSLSLAQSIQSCITKTSNQTTLGLAVKLHHKFGSRDLIDILHDYGYISTYEEVLRFRTSVAKYVGEQEYTVSGLVKNHGTISAWFDNYDLNVFTPNGMRETHAMAIEFMQHPYVMPQEIEVADKDELPVIPRLSRIEMDKVNLSKLAPVKMETYEGPEKM